VSISYRGVSLWFCIIYRTAPCLTFIPIRNYFQLECFSESVSLSVSVSVYLSVSLSVIHVLRCASRVLSVHREVSILREKHQQHGPAHTHQIRAESRADHVGHTVTDTRLCCFWSRSEGRNVSEAGQREETLELRKVRYIWVWRHSLWCYLCCWCLLHVFTVLHPRARLTMINRAKKAF